MPLRQIHRKRSPPPPLPRQKWKGKHNAVTSRARIFKRLRSPGIDSKEWIPPAYVAWRAGTINLFLLGAYSPHRLFKNSSSVANQTMPCWLEGEGVKTTENKIHWPPLQCTQHLHKGSEFSSYDVPFPLCKLYLLKFKICLYSFFKRFPPHYNNPVFVLKFFDVHCNLQWASHLINPFNLNLII